MRLPWQALHPLSVWSRNRDQRSEGGQRGRSDSGETRVRHRRPVIARHACPPSLGDGRRSAIRREVAGGVYHPGLTRRSHDSCLSESVQVSSRLIGPTGFIVDAKVVFPRGARLLDER